MGRALGPGGPARTAGGFAWWALVGLGGSEEGNLVVPPAAPLRPAAAR